MNFDLPEAISSQTQPGRGYGNEEIGHGEKAIVDNNQVVPRARTYCVEVFETRLLNSLLRSLRNTIL